MDIFDDKEDGGLEEQEEDTEPNRLKASSNPVYLSAENLQEMTKSGKVPEKPKRKPNSHALLTEQKLK